MAAHLSFTLGYLLLLASLAFSVTAYQHNRTCVNPKVRKEWRQLSESERSDWINAVNVSTSNLPSPPFIRTDSCFLVPGHIAPRPETTAYEPLEYLPDSTRFQLELFL